MKYSITFILTGLALIVFSACSPTPSGSSSASSSWDKAIQSHYYGLSATSISELNKLSIPLLKSDSLSKRWGDPKMEKSANGYRLSYTDPSQPFRRVMIYGMNNPLPALNSPPMYSGEEMVNGELSGYTRAQGWRSAVSIAGKPVRWFMDSASGGADGAYYSTEGFTASSNGKKGHYRIVVESGEGASAEKEVARWLKTIGF